MQGQDVTEMEGKLSQKKMEMENYKKLVHPIRRLPVEVLCEIFLSLASNEDVRHGFRESTLSATTMPWVVSQVSRLWRSSALGFPRLWSTIHVVCCTPADLQEETIQKQLSALAAQIHRAASRHLSVAFYIRSSPVPQLDRFLAILLPTVPRWKALLMYITPGAAESLRQIRGNLDQLSHLTLYITNASGELIPTQRTCALSSWSDTFEFAPSLHMLSSPYPMAFGYKLPLDQITTYVCFQPMTAEHLAKVFARMTNLEELILATSNDFSKSSFQLLSHPKLQSFYICSTFLDSPFQLELPLLQCLTIIENVDLDKLFSFLKRSDIKALNRLWFHEMFFTPDGCLRILQALPTLDFLCLGLNGPLDLEKISSNPASIGPALTTLHLHQGPGQPFTVGPCFQCLRIKNWVYKPESG
ncbi:hypothetical protein C8J56DRAFT_941724 [Mycena floridula]|nr:hypothetical protein C8J56DRAFT_941724 [Mycena floridula]